MMTLCGGDSDILACEVLRRLCMRRSLNSKAEECWSLRSWGWNQNNPPHENDFSNCDWITRIRQMAMGWCVICSILQLLDWGGSSPSRLLQLSCPKGDIN